MTRRKRTKIGAILRRALPTLTLLAWGLLLSCGDRTPAGRVLILGLDGLDPQVIDLLISEGQLPHFAELRQRGACAPLRSFKPLLSPILWTTIATGRTPDAHGIGHFVAVSASGEELPVTSQMRRVEALWTLASDAGRQVSTVGWWATWPPEAIDGTVVSDHVAYHFLFAEGLFAEGLFAEVLFAEGLESQDLAGTDEKALSGAARTHPPELLSRIEPWLRSPGDLSVDELARFVDLPTAELEAARQQVPDFRRDLDHFRWALATAKSYRDVGLRLWQEDEPDLQLVYIEGTDSASHLFGHLFRTEDLGGELAEQQARYGRTVEEMYRFADELVGAYLDIVDADTTLIVLSDHGFQLGELHDDPTRSRDLRRVSERFHREHGILYLYGRGVRAGSRPDAPTILDITPTVLALLGLPASDDMSGRVLEEVLVDIEVPARIATYERAGRDRVGGESATGEPATGEAAMGDSRISQAQLEHLRSLGYLGTSDGTATAGISSPQGERNLAAIHFQQGDYRGAAKMYYQLVQAEPADPGLRASLAGALGALERYDEALEHLAAALALEPLHVEAYHNRAVIHERRGDVQAALADYERALRYGPQYQPARRAYERLTGRSSLRAPRTDAEERAFELLERASEAARRARYERAEELLDEAQALAPEFVLVYQYRSNVAYLRGDTVAAAEALRRALELEPDNLLFQRNLERLRAASAESVDRDPR